MAGCHCSSQNTSPSKLSYFFDKPILACVLQGKHIHQFDRLEKCQAPSLNSAEIVLQRVPRAYEQDLKEALNDVMKLKGVCGIQNLHAWSFTNTDVVGTLHLHVSKETD
ncbi:metal tolerance protein 8 [Forsythia ovata]|uniref:Metal tolerance protein 8 n=1 Tax=Forsythia ovata TaxID=205694 RepID=A0ABD1WLB0_9LAMI